MESFWNSLKFSRKRSRSLPALTVLATEEKSESEKNKEKRRASIKNKNKAKVVENEEKKTRLYKKKDSLLNTSRPAGSWKPQTERQAIKLPESAPDTLSNDKSKQTLRKTSLQGVPYAPPRETISRRNSSISSPTEGFTRRLSFPKTKKQRQQKEKNNNSFESTNENLGWRKQTSVDDGVFYREPSVRESTKTPNTPQMRRKPSLTSDMVS